MRIERLRLKNILSFRDATIEKFYGDGFRKHHLKANSVYNKTSHAPKLLELIRPARAIQKHLT